MKPLRILFIFALLPTLHCTAKIASLSEASTTAASDTVAPEIQREPLQLLYFTASWCGPCQLMKSQTWPSPKVKAALNHYSFRTIDIDQEPKIAEQWSVRAMPTYILADPSGQQELTRMTGFMDADRMAVWLSDFHETAYATLEAQRATKLAFQQQWAQLDPLFNETISAATLAQANQALFSLLAVREGLDSESSTDLEHALNTLAQTYPERLLDGFLHEDLQVRAKIARALRSDGLDLNPWDTLEQRTRALEAYKQSIQNSK